MKSLVSGEWCLPACLPALLPSGKLLRCCCCCCFFLLCSPPVQPRRRVRSSSLRRFKIRRGRRSDPTHPIHVLFPLWHRTPSPGMATPEDPRAFSPSDFLNLSPSPHPDGDCASPAPPPQYGDQEVLPSIARKLMEDDDFLYEYPDHTALLQAQQAFADILCDGGSGSASATPSTAFTVSPPFSSSDAPAFAGAAWPYDPAQLSRRLLLSRTTVEPPAAAAGGDGEHDGENSRVVNMDMLNLAFLKGLEEANKFLPTATTFDLDVSKSKGVAIMFQESPNKGRRGRNSNGKGSRDDDDQAVEPPDDELRRRSKLVALEPDEAGENAHETAQDVYQKLVDAMQGVDISSSRSSAASSRRKGKGSAATEAVDLRTLLIHCAQAVASGTEGDRLHATELLRTIKQRSSPTGDATQRLAHCFARGLEARLAGRGMPARRVPAADLLRAYLLYMDVCCFESMAFKFSNVVIWRALNVMGGGSNSNNKKKKKVHVVDYGYSYGLQWPCLLSAWSRQEGGPPEVRITAIDVPQPGFRPAARIDATGRCLSDFARRLGVPLTFRGIAARWETVRAEDLAIDPDELLIVNGLLQLEKLMDEGAADDDIDSPSPRDTVLANIRGMRPHAFVLCVENSSYGAPFFATRFRETLFYHSAMFDMMDAVAAWDGGGAERVAVEQELIGRRAVNVVACEGADRVERPEGYRQWQVRCARAGLRQRTLDADAVSGVRRKVEQKYHRDFFVDVDGQWMLQGWKGRVLYAMSTWVATANHDDDAIPSSL